MVRPNDQSPKNISLRGPMLMMVLGGEGIGVVGGDLASTAGTPVDPREWYLLSRPMKMVK